MFINIDVRKIGEYVSHIAELSYKLRKVLSLGYYETKCDNISIDEIIDILHIVKIMNKYKVKLSCDYDNDKLYSLIKIDDLNYYRCISLLELEMNEWFFPCGFRSYEHMKCYDIISLKDHIEHNITPIIKQYLIQPKQSDYFNAYVTHNNTVQFLLRYAKQIVVDTTTFDLKKKSDVIQLMKKQNHRVSSSTEIVRGRPHDNIYEVPDFMKKKEYNHITNFINCVTCRIFVNDYIIYKYVDYYYHFRRGLYYDFVIEIFNEFIENEGLNLTSEYLFSVMDWYEFTYDFLDFILKHNKKFLIALIIGFEECKIDDFFSIINYSYYPPQISFICSSMTSYLCYVAWFARLYNIYPYDIKIFNFSHEIMEEFEKITGNLSITKCAIKK